MKCLTFKNLVIKQFFCESKRNFRISTLSECKNHNNKSIIDLKKKENAVSDKLSKEDEEIIEKLKKKDPLHPYKNVGQKMKNVMLDDLKYGASDFISKALSIQIIKSERKDFIRETDILIIGSGIIGLSCAYAIKMLFNRGIDVFVIDKNEDAPFSSVTLGAGTLTQQDFTEEVEIPMSKYCAEFLAKFERETLMPGYKGFKVPYEPLGSLYLANEKNGEKVVTNHDKLKMYNIETKLLDTKDIKKRFPWLNLDGILFGSLGMIHEGIYDPWTVLRGMKSKLFNLNTRFVAGEVIDFGCSNNRLRRVIVRLPDGTYNSIEFGVCILANGIKSLNLIDKVNALDEMVLKIRYPAVRKKRYEYCFRYADGPGLSCPIVVEPDNSYFRREGLSGLYVAGASEILDNDEDENNPYKVLDEKIKPFLCSRLGVKEIELRHGWLEHYDTNLANQLGMLGSHPCTSQFIFGLGFTKHGMLYGPAIGRALMELALYGEYQTLDLSQFHPENLYRKQHLEAEKRKKLLLFDSKRESIGDT